MSNEVLGIKETKEVLNFGFDLLEAIIKSLDDKKFSIVTDAPRFVPVISLLQKHLLVSSW